MSSIYLTYFAPFDTARDTYMPYGNTTDKRYRDWRTMSWTPIQRRTSSGVFPPSSPGSRGIGSANVATTEPRRHLQSMSEAAAQKEGRKKKRRKKTHYLHSLDKAADKLTPTVTAAE
ncbi:hypothetical protein CGRA01v4_07810 [Colletotrichum graminicola]|nr:hypothetical protein CGRA01v4_07810 [Colletotrichum graminicola]